MPMKPRVRKKLMAYYTGVYVKRAMEKLGIIKNYYF
jgi:hypothetical protein